jgi:hypothetical protein
VDARTERKIHDRHCYMVCRFKPAVHFYIMEMAPSNYIGCSERRMIGHWLTRVIKNTEQSKIEASITLDGVTLTDSLLR